MSEKVIQALSIISEELSRPDPNTEKIGLMARSVRWQPSFDQEDKEALLDMGTRLQDERDPKAWIVERTILEILCGQAGPEHVEFLEGTFKMRGKHGDDRRRFALQALSAVVARYDDARALAILEEGLSHTKKDARGWTIGFLVDSYQANHKPLPKRLVIKLNDMMVLDKSADVRVEASRALADIGIIDADEMDAVLEESRALEKDRH
jgi:hypothetical protein